jgi:hypothetical protein
MFLVSACPTGILALGVELRHLRYVVAVAEMENVSRAAEAGTGSVAKGATYAALGIWKCAKEAFGPRSDCLPALLRLP